jgi:hypothetical protein
MPGLSDKFDLQFRVETFNVFNHTNFSVTSISSGIAHNDLLQSALSQLAKTEGMKRPIFGRDAIRSPSYRRA